MLVAVHVVVQLVRPGGRRGRSLANRFADLVGNLLAHLVERLVVEQIVLLQDRDEARDRVTVAPGVDLVGGAVDLPGVGHGVAAVAVRRRLEQRGLGLLAGAREQPAGGLPDGEHIDFDLVTNEPWSGFNYYLGDLHSRVVINTDLPVLSTSLGHLVAHEAYPGHHTEHSRKEVGLVRRRGHVEETIFLVGTPQCLLAEGLADLGLEVIVPAQQHETVSEHLRPMGIRYDAEIASAVAEAGELLGNAVRGNVALLLHVDGASEEDAVAFVQGGRGRH